MSTNPRWHAIGQLLQLAGVVVPPCGMGAVLSLHHYAIGVPQSGIGGAAAFFIGRKLRAQ